MNLTLRALLCVSVIGASLSSAKADGPTDYPGYVDGEPSQVIDADSSQVYQPPPEGVCFDDENQSYDCSKDEDYQSYSSIDDGYDPGAHEDFRDALAPYGQWVQTAQYGNVWVPSSEVVGADFTPYFSGGRWSYTDYGWTWVSEYNWGWAPFHYGRWLTVPGYGWSWVPGRIWGPAWVHWRSGGGYVGWAPLPPRGMVIARPVPGSRWNYWNFTAPHQLLLPRLQRLAPAYLPSIYGRTVITTDFRSIGSTRVVVGPPLHHFPGVRVVPAPLGSLQIALPRSHVVVRPGVPLGSRTYYTPHYRPTWGTPTTSLPRPGFPPVYQRPATPPPYQQRPGGWNQPGQAPPYQQRPGGWNQPGQAPPYQQRPGGWNQPGQAPPYQQRPQPGQPPIYQRPGYPQGPGPQQPPRFEPRPMPQQPPVQQQPRFEPRPMPQQPPVQQQPPRFEPRPMPQQPPVQQQPRFEPRPMPQQPPVQQQPRFEPRPMPQQPPVQQQPRFEPRPMPQQPPVQQQPRFEPRPMPQQPPVQQQPRFEPRPMPQQQPRFEPRPMPQQPPRFEPRPMPQQPPRFEPRPMPQQQQPGPAPGPGRTVRPPR